ncbi:MAG TPA: twin-arginine translocation signal domain-containing protein, partial [Ohtaekwangia sp.]|nr:twin-arginine translocation signal domain-containing protein [Ohtaekwangia sp.]
MKTRSDRRAFLKKIGVGGVGAAVLPGTIAATTTVEAEKVKPHAVPHAAAARDFNGSYSADFLKRIAFPIGGMGAGMFCLEGSGAISHMSVRNKPDVFNEPVMFGAVSIKGII